MPDPPSLPPSSSALLTPEEVQVLRAVDAADRGCLVAFTHDDTRLLCDRLVARGLLTSKLLHRYGIPLRLYAITPEGRIAMLARGKEPQA